MLQCPLARVDLKVTSGIPYAPYGFGVLTLKLSRYWALPFVIRGSPGTLTLKSTFPSEFCTEMCVADEVIQKNQNTAKKGENWVYSFKMVAKTQISNSQHKISHKKWENHFSRRNSSIKFGS